MLDYSIRTGGTPEWDFQTMTRYGIQGAIQGAATFQISYLAGTMGLFNNKFDCCSKNLPTSFTVLSYSRWVERIVRLTILSPCETNIRNLIDIIIPDEDY